MVMQPVRDSKTGEVTANTTFLAPSFEADRVRLLHLAFPEPVRMITFEEHENPYTVLLKSSIFSSSTFSPKLMVDGEIRDFISRGLMAEGFNVVGVTMGGEVEAVRQIKSKREVDLLRAVNTGTMEGVRQMRKCLYPGVTENQVQIVLDETLRVGGLESFFDIVLFGKSVAEHLRIDPWLQMSNYETRLDRD
jgi:Xaa-Pro aminopeptidase